MLLKSITILSLLTSSVISFANEYQGFEVDNKEQHEKYKINLLSGKKESLRFYKGYQTKLVNSSIENTLTSITNFDQKCNNDLKDRRELTDKSYHCAYHNSNLVESKIYRKLKEYSKEENEVDRFLVARRIYNRQSFSHMDLIKIYESKNTQGQKTVEVKMRMLTDKEAKKYLDPPVEHDSVFEVAYSNFKLTQLSENQTQIDYFYASETEHWLLNKSVSVSKVFDSMAKSIDLLFTSIDQELAKQNTKESSIKTKVVKN